MFEQDENSSFFSMFSNFLNQWVHGLWLWCHWVHDKVKILELILFFVLYEFGVLLGCAAHNNALHSWLSYVWPSCGPNPIHIHMLCATVCTTYRKIIHEFRLSYSDGIYLVFVVKLNPISSLYWRSDDTISSLSCLSCA